MNQLISVPCSTMCGGKGHSDSLPDTKAVLWIALKKPPLSVQMFAFKF